MESVTRALIVYFFLLIIFRISGKRTLAQTTNFELVLLLIISETTQQAMVDSDHSITNGFILIMTLVGTSILLSVLKAKFRTLEKWLDGVPLILIKNGKMIKERMDKNRVDEEDILAAARELHGIEKLSQIKHAVLERSGEISIIPVEKQQQ